MLVRTNNYAVAPHRAQRSADLFDRVWSELWANTHAPRGRYGFPPVTWRRVEDGLRVEAEVPGFGPEDIDITVEDDVLTITGTHLVEADSSAEEGEEGEEVGERRVPAFTRRLRLSEDIDLERVSASVSKGLLQLDLPHRPAAPVRSIEVRQGGSSGRGAPHPRGGGRRVGGYSRLMVRSALPLARTLCLSEVITPSSSMTTVVRSTPSTSLPYIFLVPQAP